MAREPCVRAPLSYESITFLALTPLPLSTGLSNSAARFGVFLTLMM